jgi:hypothetical protein
LKYLHMFMCIYVCFSKVVVFPQSSLYTKRCLIFVLKFYCIEVAV